MTDLELQVPQHIEHRLHDALAPRGLLVGKQEQQVDIGSGCKRAAPVAAGRHQSKTLAERSLARGVEMSITAS